jgi:hypothetical protein
LLFFVAAFVIVSSGLSLLGYREPHPSFAGIILLIVAAFGMPWLASQKRKLATQIASAPLTADVTKIFPESNVFISWRIASSEKQIPDLLETLVVRSYGWSRWSRCVRPRQTLSMRLCFRYQSIGPEVGTNLRPNKLPMHRESRRLARHKNVILIVTNRSKKPA